MISNRSSLVSRELANTLYCFKLITCRDGYILIQAFNSALHVSSKAWGFIPEEDVHNTLNAGGEEGKEWTFRRVGNLTCWAA